MKSYMQAILAVAIVSSFFALEADSPQITYGGVEDLAGVKTYFLDTGTSLKLHKKITSTIKSRIPEVQLVKNPKDADVVLRFGYAPVGSVNWGQATYLGSSTAMGFGFSRQVVAAWGLAFKATSENERLIVFTYEPRRGSAVAFAQKFVSAWRKANPQKPK